MAERVTRSPARQDREVDEDSAPPPGSSGSEASSDTDALLDEIDAVLEENAAEFVKQYVQKGGQ